MVATVLSRSRAADFVELTKPGIVGLVLFTVGAGFYLAAPPAVRGVTLVHTLLGAALVAAGTNALNHLAERDVDARMRRTRGRPLPAGRLSAAEAAWFGWSLGLGGIAYLGLLVSGLVAALAAATLGLYAFAYTPLKRRTSLATLVGAVPGALPVLGGWAAGRGTVGPEAWVLFALLFLWQLPHFLALAWMYRDDYARAGLKILSVTAGPAATFRQALLGAVALWPVSLAPTVVGTAGPLYAAGATALSAWLIGTAAVAARHRSVAGARRLFVASVIYLPAVLTLMVLDKVT